MGRWVWVVVLCTAIVAPAWAHAQRVVYDGNEATAAPWVRQEHPEIGREIDEIAAELQAIVDAMHAARDAGTCRMCNNLSGRVNGARLFVEGFFRKIASHSREGTRGDAGHDAFVAEQVRVWNAELRMPLMMLPRSDFADAAATVTKLEALTGRVEALMPKIRRAIDGD